VSINPPVIISEIDEHEIARLERMYDRGRLSKVEVLRRKGHYEAWSELLCEVLTNDEIESICSELWPNLRDLVLPDSQVKWIKSLGCLKPGGVIILRREKVIGYLWLSHDEWRKFARS
jgi:hypothetical protein